MLGKLLIQEEASYHSTHNVGEEGHILCDKLTNGMPPERSILVRVWH